MRKLVIFRWAVIGGLIIFTALVWLIILHKGSQTLTVSFLDVGQGDAIFIEAPNGNQILIDGGAGRQILRALGEVLPWYDKSIDVIVATHPDADHIGGLSFVVERFKVLASIDNGVLNDTNAYKLLHQKIASQKIRQILGRRGMRIVLDKDIYIDILAPAGDMSEFDSNDGSIVTRLVYGDNEFLLTGDLPQNREIELVQIYGSSIESDVLKLGHHGSKTSSSPYFLDTVKPKVAVISAGKDNRYGHPHQIVIDRLKNKNISYLNTAEMGTITLESDGDRLVCKKCGR